ncbi:MAG: hypothetical protein A2855_00235 [Candidatus Liptonbacteria bacterium RIFCSPHIGHO2_01_FULL_57_28]|uniref:Uncharacterized protein n=1 Tax=Candidatus Liptonbacteria bacterium RIFCSPHIGHO2_01_FULL_57_28 TaxID=1798647 RepID=A0A1G2C8N8_9BACT|nr:MAG: hypothetical protein A2855_00235 [Candidatus Liptonbacteria bacterium RIFCSPHIGHO2_01_FULL_57_28]
MGIEQGPSGQESADLEILRAKVREAASSSRTSGEARFTDKFDAGELLDEDLEIAHRANTAGVTTGEFQCWKKTVLDHELQRSGGKLVPQTQLSSRGQFMAFLSSHMDYDSKKDVYRLMKGSL